MRYIDVEWIHELKEEPIRLVSEIGADEFETRKLEFYANGKVSYASNTFSSGNTALGTVAVPSISEINEQKEFVGKTIIASEFEALWVNHVPKKFITKPAT